MKPPTIESIEPERITIATPTTPHKIADRACVSFSGDPFAARNIKPAKAIPITQIAVNNIQRPCIMLYSIRKKSTFGPKETSCAEANDGNIKTPNNIKKSVFLFIN